MTTSIQHRTRQPLIWMLVIPILLGIVSFWAAGHYRSSIESVSHTETVLVDLEDLLLTITDAESSLRGFLLTGDEAFRSRYVGAKNQVPGKIASLRRLTSNNQKQQANLDRLSSSVKDRIMRMERVLTLRLKRHLPDAEAIERMRQGGIVMAHIRQSCEDMKTQEMQLLAILTHTQRSTEVRVIASFVLGTLFSLALLYWAYRLIQQYGTERDRAEAEIRRLIADLEARVQERTAELKAANEQLSRSNNDLSQFAYVASHDLQEPLRTIGSYASLLGRCHQGHQDEQAAKYIRHIVDGAKRMQTPSPRFAHLFESRHSGDDI